MNRIPSIKCGHCKKTHHSVDEVRQCSKGLRQTEPTLGDRMADVLRPRRKSTSDWKFVTEDGMYKVGDTIYKVQKAVHGSGRLYAKRLVIEEPDCGGCQNADYCDPPCPSTGTFVYEAGAMARISPDDRMTVEEAADFGRLYGFCVRCGATLTDEESIARGMGPICAGKI